MSKFIEVIAIVEGKTEQVFIESVLAPYLARKMIFITATQVTKPGQKGGDVRFERVKKDLALHLKQRGDTYVTTFVDYYGVKAWPGLGQVPPNATPAQIAQTVNAAAKEDICAHHAEQRAEQRFIPFMAMHEFEALLFSDCHVLSVELDVDEKDITAVLDACGEPEAINNHPETAPSKRLNGWSRNGVFAKTTTGIAIARRIGIDRMREKCPLFNAWIAHFEAIVAERA